MTPGRRQKRGRSQRSRLSSYHAPRLDLSFSFLPSGQLRQLPRTMSIPSSPPALPDEVFNEPPSSPPLLPTAFPSRKRHARWDYDSSMSSDPIFSEDASEESEVTGIKRKRYVRGPWYQHSNSPAMARVRGETRKGDSGVWMGSDSSTDSIGGSNRRMQSLTFNEYMHKGAPLTQRQSPAKARDVPQECAARLVLESVDACKDSVDLSFVASLLAHSTTNWPFADPLSQ